MAQTKEIKKKIGSVQNTKKDHISYGACGFKQNEENSRRHEKRESLTLRKLLSLLIIWRELVLNTNTPSLNQLNKKLTSILLWAQTKVYVVGSTQTCSNTH